VDRTAIDFGDVPLGTQTKIPLKFTFESPAPLTIQADALTKVPFFLQEDLFLVGSTTWFVTFQGSGPGDYTSSFTWTTPVTPPGLPAACLWTTTTRVHARILGLDSVDAGSDVDAPNDAAAEASTD
jgi:hypothetical protein